MGQVPLFLHCDETELRVRKAERSKAVHPMVTRKQQKSVYANRLVPFVPPPPPYYWMVLATFRVGFLSLSLAPTDTTELSFSSFSGISKPNEANNEE